jgi:hypothetical protein
MILLAGFVSFWDFINNQIVTFLVSLAYKG